MLTVQDASLRQLSRSLSADARPAHVEEHHPSLWLWKAFSAAKVAAAAQNVWVVSSWQAALLMVLPMVHDPYDDIHVTFSSLHVHHSMIVQS